MKFWRDITTGIDGESFDVGRVFGLAAGSSGIFLSAWDVIVNHVPFNALAFGGGMAALAAGVGAFLKLKEGSEPDPPTNPPKE